MICLPATSSIDYYMNSISLGFRKAVFYYSFFVAVTGHRSPTKRKTSFFLDLGNRSQKSQTTRKVAIPPMFQAEVQAHCQIWSFVLFRIRLDLPPNTSFCSRTESRTFSQINPSASFYSVFSRVLFFSSKRPSMDLPSKP